ncbi:MAG: tyrosine-type recombinase/integrase [Bacteroidota bacterium]
MSLSLELQRYLEIRRNLGFDLGTAERVLKQFVCFLETKNETHITSELFLQWKQVFGKAAQYTWAARLGMVRIFASWLHSFDVHHEIPPQSLIPCHYRRKQPYIYTDDQIRSIIEAAGVLPSINGFRALTYPAFFGLVSVTGLRISEAISLNNKDVDLQDGIITLYNGKNGKDRILPVTECTKKYLKEYSRKRDRLLGQTPEPFFVSDEGIRLTDCAVRYNFVVIGKMIGLRAHQRFYKHGIGPRIHDLRHTFAVKVMINWYKEGKNIDQEMLKLVTYLGHKSMTHTYWYIEAVPELLALASQRAEDCLEKEVQS